MWEVLVVVPFGRPKLTPIPPANGRSKGVLIGRASG